MRQFDSERSFMFYLIGLGLLAVYKLIEILLMNFFSFQMNICISNHFFEYSRVKIRYIENYIPPECVIEYVKLDLWIKPSYNHTKLFEEEKFNGSKFYYKGVVDDINKAYWDFNASYVRLNNMYCCGNGSFCSLNYTFILLDNDEYSSWIRKPRNGLIIDYYDSIIEWGIVKYFSLDIILVMF